MNYEQFGLIRSGIEGTPASISLREVRDPDLMEYIIHRAKRDLRVEINEEKFTKYIQLICGALTIHTVGYSVIERIAFLLELMEQGKSQTWFCRHLMIKYAAWSSFLSVPVDASKGRTLTKDTNEAPQAREIVESIKTLQRNNPGIDGSKKYNEAYDFILDEYEKALKMYHDELREQA